MTKPLLLLFVWMLERGKTNEGFMIHRDQYSEIWRQEGIDNDIITEASKLYEYLPANVVYAVASDDHWAGVAPFVIKYTDKYVNQHDARFRLKSLGYPISTNLETNADLLLGESETIVKNVLLVPLMAAIGVGGSVLGYFWWCLK